MSIPYSTLEQGFKDLRLRDTPVIIHASLRSFGEVEAGARSIVSALAVVFPVVMAPAFTYKTMINPLIGPADNAMTYGSAEDANRMAEFFTPDMPVDPLIGRIPETLRKHPLAERSGHPILSFTGIRAGEMLAAQSLSEPFGPLEAMEKADGWVLLLGVNQTVNTSIHLAEKQAGRRTFTRWALTPQGVVECPSFPGCSAGFEAIAPLMKTHIREVQIGKASIQAMPIKKLLEVVSRRIKKDPLAMLCQQEDCERCAQLRRLG